MAHDRPDISSNATNPIAREHLLTGTFGALVERIEAHRITLPPDQKAGRHTHPGGVVGYVVEGDIVFEIEGQPPAMLRAGSVFCEPPGATIVRFDNASATTAATFIAFYPLAGDQARITFFES